MEAILVFIGFNMIIALVIGLAASWVLRRKARRTGYSSIMEYLRAVPRSDREKQDAINFVLQGLVICVFGLLIPPLVLIGVFPLFIGVRKLLSALVGLGFVDDID